MNKDFIPVLLGTDINVYGMASSFYDLCHKKSFAIGKGLLTVSTCSNILSVAKVEPNIEEDEVFVKTLIDFKKEYENQELLLVPCGDNYAKLLVRNQDKLRDYYTFICNDLETFETLSTKERFYNTCKKYNLPYPETVVITKDNYKNFKLSIDYPVIIKPSNSVMYWNAKFTNKKKVFLAYNREDFMEILEAIYNSTYADNLIIQKYIKGDDSHDLVVNTYSNNLGKVKMMSVGHVVLEECTPEGIGSYAAIISDYDETIINLLKDFLEKIKYKGYANFDFKYDEESQEYKLFEINPRQGRSSYYVSASGVNITKCIVKDLIYKEDLELEIGREKVLYSIVPKSIIRKYIKDEKLKREVNELIKNKKFINSYINKDDKNLKRKINFLKNQLLYHRKYKKYFVNKGLYE